MTLAEYNQHVTRCAQLALGLHPGDKVTAKARLPELAQGLRVAMLATTADAINTLLFSAHAHAADALVMRASIADAAWCAHLADVRARIDALP